MIEEHITDKPIIPLTKEPWQMTREELEADPRFVITDQIALEAKVLLNGKIALHPTKFFEYSTEGREEIIRHELGHLKVRSLLKDKGKQFWLISDSQLFGKYDAEKKEWIPIEGFYSVNLDETLANAISMYEMDSAGFTKKFPRHTPIVKALSEGKPITPEMVELALRTELTKEPWRMTRKEFFANPPEEVDIWLVEGKPPHRGKIGSSPDFFGGPPTRGYRVANTVTPFDVAHKNIVKHALKEGKSVPQEVLRDYPDLTRKVNSNHIIWESEHIT